jgi:hypothetical protein
MKPLDDEKKQKIWEEISKAIKTITQQSDNELTIDQIHELIGEGYAKEHLRRRLNHLVDENILGKRRIVSGGARYNVYFPVADTTAEEVLELLTE